MKNKKPKYKIFWDTDCWIAVSSEFKSISGLGITPKEALKELFIALSGVKD